MRLQGHWCLALGKGLLSLTKSAFFLSPWITSGLSPDQMHGFAHKWPSSVPVGSDIHVKLSLVRHMVAGGETEPAWESFLWGAPLSVGPYSSSPTSMCYWTHGTGSGTDRLRHWAEGQLQARTGAGPFLHRKRLFCHQHLAGLVHFFIQWRKKNKHYKQHCMPGSFRNIISNMQSFVLLLEWLSSHWWEDSLKKCSD